MVYEAHWDTLFVDDKNATLRNKVKLQFTPQAKPSQIVNKGKDTPKPTFVLSILPPIPAKLPKEVKEISKFFKKIEKPPMKKSYAQASALEPNSNGNSSNIAMNTLKIKETFPNLSNTKINSIQKVINDTNVKAKLRLNITTKGPSHKQVIIPMSSNLGKRFTKDSSSHIININRSLKNIKSKICTDNRGVIILTNNVASNLDLQEIKKYVKNSLATNDDSISSPQLPQSKSYLKIVGIPYFVNKSNTHISFEDIEHILKNNHIFNDIILASKPCIIKVSPKSDMAIVWINIWDTQNSNNVKKVINRRFNVGNIVTIVKGANMNPGVPQCKNCWKWGHSTGICCIQESKCAKCNGPHLTDNHCDFAWYYKANSKSTPPRIETKKGEPCPHMFKCLNCKGSYVTDSVECPFWKHCFNKEWHSKEYSKLREARRTLICSGVNEARL